MKLKPRLAMMEGFFKDYAKNMLQENSSIELHKQLDEKAAAEINNIYKDITLLLWNVCSLLSPGQKLQIKKMMDNPGNDNFINGFLNSINKVAN